MGGFAMKPSRAYGGLLLVLVITQAVECRSIVGNQHHQDAAGDHKHVREGKFREGVKVEIIHKPKELKVFVNKSPTSREESVKNDSKKDWQQIQSEMIKNGIKTSLNQGWESSLPSEEETDNVDDSYETGESGDGSRRDVVNIHHVLHGQSFVSRDHNHHQRSRIRHAQHTKRPNSSSGGLGILWSLVIFAFVLSVIAVVFLGRWCCYGNVPDAELESVKVEHTNYSPKKSAIKEARIREGKRKSLENRKVLRRLSADQGASTVKEELAIACSVISPSIDTRRKNSEALHTRACVRAATSHSRRNSSFQEDLLKARCEFENAPARFAKLVSLAGDEKDTDARQESGEPIKSAAGDTAVIINCN